MKTSISKCRQYLILCILICITVTFVSMKSTTLKADSENGVAIDDTIGHNLPSIDLPQVKGPLYLDCSLPKTRFFLGERIPITITLYINELVISNVDKPILNQPDFLIDILNSAQKQLRVNDRPYKVITFSCLLSPLQTGSFLLGPFTENCYLASNGYVKRRTIEITTRQVPVKVINLPNQHRPDNFSGGIGNFQLAVSATSHQIKQGEPLTIKMRLSGNGNLQSVSSPLLKNTSGLKVYSPLKNTGSSTSQGSWNQVTFEQIIIPLDKKKKQIGPFDFSFFNPNTGKYERIEASAIPIFVTSNPGFTNDEQSSTTQILPQAKMAPIKKVFGTLYLKDRQLIKQPWFWFWQVLPLLLLAGALIYRRYTEFMSSDSPRARAIRSTNLAKQQLAAAQIISNEGRYDDLLDQLHQILREYLGGRFNLASAGMTGSVVSVLKDKGLPTEILQNIQLFFEQYDMHCFAKLQFTRDEALKLENMVSAIIVALDQI
jgi:hypothetical protein